MSSTGVEACPAPAAQALVPGRMAVAARWAWTLLCAAMGVTLGGVLGVIVGLLTGLIPVFC